MADDDIWPDNTEPETETEPEAAKKDNLKELREAAERGRKASRELVFAKAGIDTDSKQGQLLMRSYDGEMTREAIKTYQEEVAASFGVGAKDPEPEPDVTGDAAAQAARTALATGGQVPSTESQPDPYEEAAKAKAKAISLGRGRDEALADGFRVLLAAASNNDPRVEVGNNRP